MFLKASRTMGGGFSTRRRPPMMEKMSSLLGQTSSHRQQLLQIHAPPSSPLARYEGIEGCPICEQTHTSRQASQWLHVSEGLLGFIVETLGGLTGPYCKEYQTVFWSPRLPLLLSFGRSFHCAFDELGEGHNGSFFPRPHSSLVPIKKEKAVSTGNTHTIGAMVYG